MVGIGGIKEGVRVEGGAGGASVVPQRELRVHARGARGTRTQLQRHDFCPGSDSGGQSHHHNCWDLFLQLIFHDVEILRVRDRPRICTGGTAKWYLWKGKVAIKGAYSAWPLQCLWRGRSGIATPRSRLQRPPSKTAHNTEV